MENDWNNTTQNPINTNGATSQNPPVPPQKNAQDDSQKNRSESGAYIPNTNFGDYISQGAQGASSAQGGYAYNPYAQNSRAYGYRANAQNGYTVNPQNAYQPAGYYYPPKPNPWAEEKKKEKKQIRNLSTAHGLSVLGFSVLAAVLSAILVNLIPDFAQLYKHNDLFNVTVNSIFSAITIFVPFWITYLLSKKKGYLDELPLNAPKNKGTAVLLIFAALAVCLAGSYASGVFNTVLETLFHIEFDMPPDTVKYNSVPVVLLSFVQVAFIPALVEEFAIRGVVMQSLKKYGDWFAILMSAMVFALMHGNMVQIPFAFIAGIAIGYAVIATGSMWTGVIIHFLNNTVALLFDILDGNLSELTANIIGLVILFVIFAAGIACIVVYIMKTKKVVLSKSETHLSSGECVKAYVFSVAMVLAIVYLLTETAQYVHFVG